MKPNSKKAPAKKRPTLPVSTAVDPRLRLFPVSALEAPRVEQTPWGDIKIERGNTREIHRSVIEAIMINAEQAVYVKEQNQESGGQPQTRLHVAFDARKVLNTLETSAKYTWLRGKLLDLQATVCAIRGTPSTPSDRTAWPKSWNIIESVGDSTLDAARNEWEYPAKLKKVVFSPEFTKFLEDEVKMFFRREIGLKLLSMKHAVSRAVARWCLSHSQEQHVPMETMFSYVGVECGDRVKRDYLKGLREDAPLLAELGIAITEGHCHYEGKCVGVWFKGRQMELAV